MADEKTLFNRNVDNDNEEAKKHPIMKEEESDFVDFSSAFEDDEDADVDKYDDEYEEERRAPALFRGLSLFRRRKDFDEDSLPIETEEIEELKEDEEKEDVQPVKEEAKEEALPEKKKKKKNKKNKNKKEEILLKEETEKFESQDVVDFEASINDAEEDENEEIVEEQKPEKKKKGFSFFAKKEKEFEIPVEEEIDTETVAEEQPVQEEMTGEVIEIPEETEESTDEIIIVLDDSEETTEDVAEEIVLIDDFQEEAEEIVEETVEEQVIEEQVIEEQVIEENEKGSEEQKPEKKFARFAFLNKRQRVISSPKEEPIEEIIEKVVEEPEVELLPSFEEAEAVREEPAQAEPVAEETAEVETVEKIEEIPPFEATAEETTETVIAQEEIKEIPPFEEAVAENTVEPVVEITEESVPKKKKKEKKEKKIKESVKEQTEKTSVDPMTMKDHLTFILIILALLLTIAFIVLKFIPLGNNDRQNTEINVATSESVSEIEIQRKDALGHLIQSDIDNVFYAYSPDYGLTYYQCDDRGMKTIQQTEKVNAIVDIRSEKVSVKVDYVQVDGKLFGTGVFRKTDSQGDYLHDTIVFKLVNLPKGYEEDGKALLLATTNSEAVSRSCNVWDDSFVVDLETGTTTRFISSSNSMYSLDYSILTDEGYASTNGKIPFFTTREYDATTNKKDIYLKVNGKESRLATDVAGSFVYVNGDTVSYLKSTEKDFNVIRNNNGKEQLVFLLDNNTSYLYHNEYLLDKYNGILYNVKTGEKITITGYGMSNPEMMAVSSDGKYLVVLGTVNSAIDYQVHIFDLEKNEYAKYVDDNFSKHENLAFVDDTTIVYSVVEPKQGYEYVMLDTSKAFK